ncbi:Solitary outer membrane autotransporter beta-barrel domain, partial [Vibrio diabolicus]
MKQAVINSYALATLSLFSLCSKANSIQDQIQKEYERNFAIGIVLSDSDVFTVGFHDFDPNEYFNIDNEDIGTQD